MLVHVYSCSSGLLQGFYRGLANVAILILVLFVCVGARLWGMAEVSQRNLSGSTDSEHAAKSHAEGSLRA